MKPITIDIVKFLNDNFLSWRKVDKTSLAILVSVVGHFGITDKGGHPYIFHVIAVTLGLRHKDAEIIQAALLHDIVEDTNITLADLKLLGFSKRVIDCVAAVTKDESLSYQQNIARVLPNLDACYVKLSDLTNNTLLSRLKDLSEKTFSKMRDYMIAYKRVEAVIDAAEKSRSDQTA